MSRKKIRQRRSSSRWASLVSSQIALGDVAEPKMRSASGHEADSSEERVMAASHSNAAISDTSGDWTGRTDAVTPTSAYTSG
jgi:hypothetical protein